MGENRGVEREFYSLTEAAKLADVSESTMRRKREQLREVGAVFTHGHWRITVAQLAAVGLLSSVDAVPVSPLQDTVSCSSVTQIMEEPAENQPDVAALHARISELEALNDHLQVMLADDRRIINAYEIAFRQIEAAKQEPVERFSFFKRWFSRD